MYIYKYIKGVFLREEKNIIFSIKNKERRRRIKREIILFEKSSLYLKVKKKESSFFCSRYHSFFPLPRKAKWRKKICILVSQIK